ncbi:MAG TPA: response regulator transcription factor [Thermoanaerobaculia bacterium]|nr:response regulator transcription factor [Thermoanaerobaculia bacterium]
MNPTVYATAFASGVRMPESTGFRELGAWIRLAFMSSPIGVFIVSRNRLFADALALLLNKREELTVTGTSADPETVAARSNVLLIDATGDDREVSGALARLRSICERADACKALVLGLPREDERLIDFIEAGAQAYVLRGTSPADLVEAIRGAHAGRSRCSAQVAAAVVARIVELEGKHTKVDRREREPLTAREREVLAWMATGRCNKEIGSRLHISVQTVKNHVHSILAKLGATRRREALRIAYEIGLLRDWGDPPPEG